MPFEFFLARTAERRTLIQCHVIANDRGFSNDDPHSVINEQATPNLRCRMNLDAGQEPGDLGEPSGQQAEMVVPKPVRKPVRANSVQTRVTQHDFKSRFGRWIAFQN
jgi:hypothetical protein